MEKASPQNQRPGEAIDASTESRLEDIVDEWLQLYGQAADPSPGRPPALERSVAFTMRSGGTLSSWNTGMTSSEASDDPLSVPAVIGEKWRLTELKNTESTFGFFYVGEHRILKMKVGVKVLRGRFTSTRRGRHLFHQEAMRVSLLNHPNIVKVFDYGDEKETPYLVMEYLSGKPLTRYLAGEEKLTLDDGIEVVRQVAEALMHAHEGAETDGPLVHLDLKPDHIYLERVGDRLHVKVIDFGIAEIVGAPEHLETQEVPPECEHFGVAGTLPYMAPERFAGRADPRSDLYSLGVILYEIVAGRRPFVADSFEKMHKLHSGSTPPPPSQYRDGNVTRSVLRLDDLALWLLEKRVEERPATARDLQHELRAWQERRRRERERLLSKKRLKRLALALLMLGVPLLLLLLWAPWEEIPTPKLGLILGAAPRQLDVFVGGYEGQPSHLVIEEPGGTHATFALGPVDKEQRVRHVWPTADAIAAKLPGALGGPLRARVTVDRLFWGTVKSPQIEVFLDTDVPELTTIQGALYDAGNALVRIVGRRTHELCLLTREEALDLDQCSWNGMRGEPCNSSRADTFQVRAQPHQDHARVVLVDLAGNRWERTLRLEWLDPPSLVRPRVRDIKTTHEEYPLELDFKLPEGIAATVQLVEHTAGGEHVLQETSDSHIAVTLRLDRRRNQTPAVRQLTARVWLAPSTAALEPDLLHQVTITSLARDLSIEPQPSTEHTLRTYRVSDTTGDTVEDAELVVALYPEGSAEPLPGVMIDSRSGRVTTSAPIRGHFRAVVEATDAYGNRAQREDRFTFPPPPTLSGLVPFDRRGTEALPLYRFPEHWHPEEARKPFRLRADVHYHDTSRLQARLLVADEPRHPVPINTPFFAEDGKALVEVVDIEDLMRRLRPGPNVLTLQIWDRDASTLQDKESCIIFFSDVDVKIHPHESNPAHLDAEGKLEVRAELNGPIVTNAVAIDGHSLELGSQRGHPAFSSRVTINLFQKTAVELVIETGDGARFRTTRAYEAAPRSDLWYGFEDPDSDDRFALRYFPGDDRQAAFWFSLPRLYPVPPTARRGGSYLPTPEQLAVIGQAGSSGKPDSSEWVRDASPTCAQAGWRDSVARWDHQGRFELHCADRKLDRFGYRLIFPAETWAPRQAVSAERVR